jgi:hypothetical protein
MAQDEDSAHLDQGCPVTTMIANPCFYTFTRGSRITSPPAEFCSYFSCISIL